jgi:hypothetical protein
VDLGEVPVEHHHVVPGHQRLLDRDAPVICDIGRDPPVAQAVGDVVRQLPMVFDDENAHTDIVHQPASQRHHNRRSRPAAPKDQPRRGAWRVGVRTRHGGCGDVALV